MNFNYTIMMTPVPTPIITSLGIGDPISFEATAWIKKKRKTGETTKPSATPTTSTLHHFFYTIHFCRLKLTDEPATEHCNEF